MFLIPVMLDMKEELITFALKAFVVGAVAVGVIHFNHTHDIKLMKETHDYTNAYDSCMRRMADRDTLALASPSDWGTIPADRERLKQQLDLYNEAVNRLRREARSSNRSQAELEMVLNNAKRSFEVANGVPVEVAQQTIRADFCENAVLGGRD